MIVSLSYLAYLVAYVLFSGGVGWLVVCVLYLLAVGSLLNVLLLCLF